MAATASKFSSRDSTCSAFVITETVCSNMYEHRLPSSGMVNQCRSDTCSPRDMFVQPAIHRNASHNHDTWNPKQSGHVSNACTFDGIHRLTKIGARKLRYRTTTMTPGKQISSIVLYMLASNLDSFHVACVDTRNVDCVLLHILSKYCICIHADG